MTLLYFWSCFSSFLSFSLSHTQILCLFTMNATIPIQWRFLFALCICLRLFVFFVVFFYYFYFYYYCYFFLLSSFLLWFLHHLLFFFHFGRCVRLLFWCFSFSFFLSVSVLSSSEWRIPQKGEKKHQQQRNDLTVKAISSSSFTHSLFYDSESMRARVKCPNHKHTPSIDFCMFFFSRCFFAVQLCHSAFSHRLRLDVFFFSSLLVCCCFYSFFVCLSCALAHIWSPYETLFLFVFSFSLCNPFWCGNMLFLPANIMWKQMRAREKWKETRQERRRRERNENFRMPNYAK